MTAQIHLECECCGRTKNLPRDRDPTLPAKVVRITQPHCNRCWSGEREGETWYDAAGREVDQAAAH